MCGSLRTPSANQDRKSKFPKIKSGKNEKIEIAKFKFDRKILNLETERNFYTSKDWKMPMILFVNRILCGSSQAKMNLSGNSYALPSPYAKPFLCRGQYRYGGV